MRSNSGIVAFLLALVLALIAGSLAGSVAGSIEGASAALRDVSAEQVEHRRILQAIEARLSLIEEDLSRVESGPMPAALPR